MSEKYCIGCGAAYNQEHATHCVKYIKPVDEVPFTYEDECKLRQENEALKAERDRLREALKLQKKALDYAISNIQREMSGGKWNHLIALCNKVETLNHKEG